MALLIVLIVSGCFAFSSPVWSKEMYKIGGIFSVTGRASFLGDPEKRSMELAIKTINAQGGIDGHLLEPVIYDSEADPTNLIYVGALPGARSWRYGRSDHST